MTEKSHEVTRRDFLQGAAVAAAGALLAACAPAATPTPQVITKKETVVVEKVVTEKETVVVEKVVEKVVTPTTVVKPKGGVLVAAVGGDPITWDPQKCSAFTCRAAFDHVYEGLGDYDENLNLVPALAESWEVPDDLTYIFHLRKGVKFHDGSEMTARDVKYTFDRALDPDTAAAMVRYIQTIDKVEVVDDYTIKLTLKQFDPAIVGACASGRVVNIIPEGAADKVNLAVEGIGTGPFKLEEYVANSHYTFSKHEDYWDRGLPYLEKLSFKIMPDEDTRIAAIRTGAVDYAPISAVGALRLVGEPGVQVLQSARAWCEYLYINTSREPWNDLRVRQAANYAIDRQEIIDKAVGGAGAMSGPIPPGYGDYSIPKDELPWEYNVERAKQLLADAGYPEGFKTTLKCSPRYPEMVSSSVVFAEQMKKIGIEVELIQMEWAQLIKETKAPLWDFDLRTGAFTYRHDPSQYLVYFRTEGSTINPGYSNPIVDELYDASVATADVDERLRLYRELQEVLMEDLPMFWLYGGVLFEAIRDHVKGYHQLFSARRTFFKTVWIDK